MPHTTSKIEMEAVLPSETLVFNYYITRWNNPENREMFPLGKQMADMHREREKEREAYTGKWRRLVSLCFQ